MALPIGFAQNRGSFHNLGRTDKTSLYPPSLSFRSSIPVFYIFLPFAPFLHLEVGSLNPARGSKERYKQKLGSVLSFLRDFVPFSINSYQMPISFQTAWRRGGIRSENRDGRIGSVSSQSKKTGTVLSVPVIGLWLGIGQ